MLCSSRKDAGLCSHMAAASAVRQCKSIRRTHLQHARQCRARLVRMPRCPADEEPFFLEDDREQEQLTPSQRQAQHWIQQQALADTNTPTGRFASLSQDTELSRLGGISPAERVFMYLQVPVLSACPQMSQNGVAAARPQADITGQCCNMPMYQACILPQGLKTGRTAGVM